MDQTPGGDIGPSLINDLSQLQPIMALIKMLTGGAGAPAPTQPGPNPVSGVQSGGSLRDRMLMEQRARQLSAPGGMGY